MVKVKCSCGSVAQLSIRGFCLDCGKQSLQVYNGAPQENLQPSTARGHRRKIVGKKKKKV